MIDMMYLIYGMTRREYNNAFSVLQSYLKTNANTSQLRKDGRDKNAYVTNVFSKYGFQEIRLRSASWGYCSIEVRLRPKLLVDRGNYYHLTKVSEFGAIQAAFNYVLKDILSLNVPDFFYWKAQRIEAAADIRLPEDLISKYLLLFKKGFIPDYFMKNAQTLEYFNSTTNLYLMSENKTVNWYNRYETLVIKEQKAGKKYEDFTELKGILRFETQVRNDSRYVHEVLSQQKLKHEVIKFYKLIIGKGDYYSLAKAEQLLTSIVSNPQQRETFIYLLKLIEQSGGINKAKELYLVGKDPKSSADKFGKSLKKIRNLNINPVVIPQEWGIDFLKNPYTMIEKEFEENESHYISERDSGDHLF